MKLIKKHLLILLAACAISLIFASCDKYQEKLPFSEGLSAVKIGGKWGYVNEKSEIVITPQFVSAFPFSEGLAKVRIDSLFSDIGYINKKGEFVIKPSFNGGESFSEGLASVQDSSNNKWGYIDKTGTYVIKPKFKHLGKEFREGVAPVEVNGLYGYIDREENIIIDFRFTNALSFSDGKAFVKIGDNAYYIDKTGKIIENIK